VLTLVLTRHGLTARSEPEQHLGRRIDIELTREGRAQGAALGKRLAPVRFERMVTSPLVRARETADLVAVASLTRPPIVADPRLAEMDYGHWEGLTYAQIDERWATERTAWEADPAANACPGGESAQDVALRARAFVDELLEDQASRHGPDDRVERPILAVAHSSLNRVLLCVVLGIPLGEYRRRFAQAPANLTVLRFAPGAGSGDARLELLNDVAHLRPPDRAPWA
jgi:broad specificity phosphatase PhoE